MVQIQVFAFCLASVVILNFVNCVDNELHFNIANVKFTTVPNMTRYLQANPKFKMIQTLAQVKNPQVKNQITYRLGNRISGKLGISYTKCKIEGINSNKNDRFG